MNDKRDNTNNTNNTNAGLFCELTPQEELLIFLESVLIIKHNKTLDDKAGTACTPTSIRLATYARLAANLICTGPVELQDVALDFLFSKLKHYMAVARGEQKLDIGFGPIDFTVKPLDLKELGLDTLFDGKPKAKP